MPLSYIPLYYYYYYYIINYSNASLVGRPPEVLPLSSDARRSILTICYHCMISLIITIIIIYYVYYSSEVLPLSSDAVSACQPAFLPGAQRERR